MWLVRTLRSRPSNVPWRPWWSVTFQLWTTHIGSEFWRSIKQLLYGVGHYFLWLVPGAFLGLAALYGQLADTEALVPLSLMWAVIGGGLAVAIVAEYHRVRRERDRLMQEPKIKLNEHLSKGYLLKEQMLKHRLPEGKNALTETISWVLIADASIRQSAPAYYSWWTRDFNEDDAAAKQFVGGLETLAKICREL